MAPTYDMIAAQMLLPNDFEDLALNLNGKKRKLKKEDFNQAILKVCIPEKAVKNLWKCIEKEMTEWPGLIDRSFLSKEREDAFKTLIKKKVSQLELDIVVE